MHKFSLNTGYFLLSLLLFFSSSLMARPIAVVMDDSGSMTHKYQTSLFAMQSLLSMLNAGDELTIVKMSNIEYPYQVDGNNIQQSIDDIRQWRIIADTGTPFSSIEQALDILVDKTQSTEEAILLVITDGDFSNDKPTDEAQAMQLFSAYQKRFKGKNLRAFFVSIETQENRHIRSALLQTFNGQADVGDIVIKGGDDTLQTLRSVYASILGVQNDHGKAVQYQDKTIRFTAPFPVLEIMLISSDSDSNSLAEVLKFPKVPQATVLQYEYAMHGTDDLSPSRLQGKTTSIKLWPPIPAGTAYRLAFNQPVNLANTQVLLKTEVAVDWELRNDSGKLLQAVNGVYKVATGQALKVLAWVESEDAQQQRYQVDLSTLPQKMRINLHSNDGQATQSQEMRAVSSEPTKVLGD